MKSIVIGIVAISFGLSAQNQPPQPASGPGGSAYANTGVTSLGPFYPPGKSGQDVYKYYIYQPSSPKPATAPVVLFFHGANANYPETYLNWMKHIVKNGYTVIWVQFSVIFSSERDYYTNAQTSYSDALTRIQNDPTMVQPVRDSFGKIKSGFVGHSLGSYIAMVIAGRSNQSGSTIPVPLAYFSSNAGFAVAETDYNSIPAATKVVFLVGADDTTVCKSSTELLFNLLPQVPVANKKFLAMRSDPYGSTDVIADHYFAITVPTPPPAMDARDYYGTWKLSVATMDCAIKGKNCEFALTDGSSQQVSMGNWSDGRAVTPLLWASAPNKVTLPCESAKRNFTLR